jgi:hypothetical protein
VKAELCDALDPVVPSTSHASDSRQLLSRATARNVRMKQSATAATIIVSGDHRSPGPPNSSGGAVLSAGRRGSRRRRRRQASWRRSRHSDEESPACPVGSKVLHGFVARNPGRAAGAGSPALRQRPARQPNCAKSNNFQTAPQFPTSTTSKQSNWQSAVLRVSSVWPRWRLQLAGSSRFGSWTLVV